MESSVASVKMRAVLVAVDGRLPRHDLGLDGSRFGFERIVEQLSDVYDAVLGVTG